MANQYKDDSIQTLSPIEHVKLRPGMYVGDTSNPNQLLLEIFSNSLDEYNIGHGKEIHVTIQQDNKICVVKDYAQGFPINVTREDGKTVLEASFSVVNSSGKFTEDGVYGGSSLGLNGLGGKITCFLSDWFEVTSWNNGKYEYLLFEEGILKSREVKPWTDKEHPSGTEVSYKPSKKYFGTDVTDIKYFKDFFNDITCLCPGLQVYLNGELIEHKSIEELIDIKNKDNIELTSNKLVIEHKEKAGQFNLALSFNDSHSSNIISYVNYGLTTIGPHITSIKSTLTRVLNKWAKEQDLLKEKDKNLEGSALQEGMLLICNLVTTNVAYNAQVKTTVTKIDCSFATNKLAEELEIWLDNNPADGRMIIEKALVARKAAEAAKKAREKVREAAKGTVKTKVNVMPSKLTDANSKNRKECEIYILEGDSASGGAKQTRDANTQAIMPLRGKLLNVLTAQTKTIQANQEIMNIVSALGLSWSADKKTILYDKNLLRYNKFVIATDADDDGAHIQALILTFLWTMLPQLIMDGFVYIAVPPLYKAEYGSSDYVYLKDDKELEEFKKTHSKFKLSRFKGLGEMQPDELYEQIMAPKTRHLEQIVINNESEFDKVIKDLMGKDSTPKKDFVFNQQGE